MLKTKNTYKKLIVRKNRSQWLKDQNQLKWQENRLQPWKVRRQKLLNWRRNQLRWLKRKKMKETRIMERSKFYKKFGAVHQHTLYFYRKRKYKYNKLQNKSNIEKEQVTTWTEGEKNKFYSRWFQGVTKLLPGNKLYVKSAHYGKFYRQLTNKTKNAVTIKQYNFAPAIPGKCILSFKSAAQEQLNSPKRFYSTIAKWLIRGGQVAIPSFKYRGKRKNFKIFRDLPRERVWGKLLKGIKPTVSRNKLYMRPVLEPQYKIPVVGLSDLLKNVRFKNNNARSLTLATKFLKAKWYRDKFGMRKLGTKVFRTRSHKIWFAKKYIHKPLKSYNVNFQTKYWYNKWKIERLRKSRKSRLNTYTRVQLKPKKRIRSIKKWNKRFIKYRAVKNLFKKIAAKRVKLLTAKKVASYNSFTKTKPRLVYINSKNFDSIYRSKRQRRQGWLKRSYRRSQPWKFRASTYHLWDLNRDFYGNKQVRKHNYPLKLNVRKFWKKLTGDSKFYNRAFMSSFGGRKLLSLYKHTKAKDKLSFANLDVKKINLNKFGKIKINLLGVFSKNTKAAGRFDKLLRPVIKTINIGHFDPFLNNKDYNIWYSVYQPKKSRYRVLIIKNPANNKVYCIKIVKNTQLFIKFGPEISHLPTLKLATRSPNKITFLKLVKNNNFKKRKNAKSQVKADYRFENGLPIPALSKKQSRFTKEKLSALKYVNRQTYINYIALLQATKFKTSLKLNEVPIKKLIVKAKNLINYKQKFFLGFDSLHEFQWKFFSKKWYFKISRWKRAATFKWFMKKAQNNYRKLSKNFMFIKLFRVNFHLMKGITEDELLKKWLVLRRGNNKSDNVSAAERLNQLLQLKLDSLAMLLGLAPNRITAQELIKCGGIRVNGLVITNPQDSINFNNIIQLDLNVNRNLKALYNQAHWAKVKARVKFVGFLQVTWPLMLFMLLRWPYKHEIVEDTILTERWLRFFIRYFPVRISKYKTAKIKWFKY